MNRLLEIAFRSIKAAAMAVMLLMALHITLDVGFRWLSGRPLEGVTEVVSHYYMVTLSFLPMAFAERRGMHISVDIIDNFVRSAAIRTLEFTGACVVAIVMALFAWESLSKAYASLVIAESVQSATLVLPIWPARWLPVIGFTLTAFFALLRATELARARR